ncbi:MAG: glycosyltransferase [Planctomycetota bacterium]
MSTTNNQHSHHEALPTLSIVICTRNRPDSLMTTLDSIWTQSQKPDELLIIDDGELPTSTARSIIENCRVHGIACRIEKNPRPGLTPARNHAATLARGDLLLFLDDDVTCDPIVIAEITRLMSDSTIAAVTATVIEPTFDSPSSRLYQLGYRLAGWWKIAPRRKPTTPPPAVLAHSNIATRARWLSGAAMALRKDVVLAEHFDESLTTYALGEDREMGYRLAPRHWLIESKRARVIHRRESSARTDSRRLGFMTTHNYLYILHKTCDLGPGHYLAIAWSFIVLAAMHLLWSLGANRRAHLLELRGMADGILQWFREAKRHKGTEAPAAAGKLRHEAPQVTLRSLRRVLFVTNRLEPGGAELMLVNLVRHLPTHNIQPFILCLKDAGPLATDCRTAGIPVFENLLHHKTDAAVIPRIRRLLDEHAIDVLVVAHSGGDRMFWSTLAAGLSDIPIVVWSHWFPEAGRHHFERPNRALYRLVDAYVALGVRHRAAMIRHEQVPAGRISVIPNALDLARFMHGVSRAEARRRLRLDDHHVAIGIIANLRREKRHDVFIESARRIAATHPHFRFFIIGDGPNRDAVQAAAAASGLDHETLRLLGPRSDIPELLSGLDISCLCSEVECFSVTMLEAAAAGCAFIGPNTGCLPEFLEHRRTGLLIRPADVASLTDALIELGQSASLRQSLSDEARASVLRDYSLERMAERFADLLTTVRKPRSIQSQRRFRTIMRSPVPIPSPLIRGGLGWGR